MNPNISLPVTIIVISRAVIQRAVPQSAAIPIERKQKYSKQTNRSYFDSAG
jgi:hypothetical protein